MAQGFKNTIVLQEKKDQYTFKVPWDINVKEVVLKEH